MTPSRCILVHMRDLILALSFGVVLSVVLAGCGGSIVGDPPPPAEPIYCPLTVADIRDGIDLYECSPRVYICDGEFVTPPGGCVVYRDSPQIAGTCIVPDPTKPGGCP